MRLAAFGRTGMASASDMIFSGYILNQMDYSGYDQRPEEGLGGKLKYLVIGIVVVAFVGLVLLSMGSTKVDPNYRPKIADELEEFTSPAKNAGGGEKWVRSECGDGKCSGNEKCSSCASDCKCGESNVCDIVRGVCSETGFDVGKRVKENFGTEDYDVLYTLEENGARKAGVLINGEVKVVSESGEVSDVPSA